MSCKEGLQYLQVSRRPVGDCLRHTPISCKATWMSNH
jgi:hypothetical protein